MMIYFKHLVLNLLIVNLHRTLMDVKKTQFILYDVRVL